MNDHSDLQAKNRRTLWWLGGLTAGMFGFGFAMVPLYGLLCQITGTQNLEQRNVLNADGQAAYTGPVAKDRWITVKFAGNVEPNLPWHFEPLERKVRVHPGEATVVNFEAVNRSSQTVTGQAIPSVAPWQATDFFSKMECFCFNQQTLEGNQRVEMPLRFVVSPDLPADIQSLTLTYNFMRIEDSRKLAGN
jgi:cytochrome c oxidase assembly protein subunit 11